MQLSSRINATDNSANQELMRKLVMKNRKMNRSTDLLTGATTSFPLLAIQNGVHGIGYPFVGKPDYKTSTGMSASVGALNPSGVSSVRLADHQVSQVGNTRLAWQRMLQLRMLLNPHEV